MLDLPVNYGCISVIHLCSPKDVYWETILHFNLAIEFDTSNKDIQDIPLCINDANGNQEDV